MSDTKSNEIQKELSLLDQLKEQHTQFLQQREQTQTNLQQLIGAIFACELMIKKHEDAIKELSSENLGAQGNGEAYNQEA
jgi:chaperonin cofactor prefoldin